MDTSERWDSSHENTPKERNRKGSKGMTIELFHDSVYQRLLGCISDIYTTGQLRAHQAVNTVITETYEMNPQFSGA